MVVVVRVSEHAVVRPSMVDCLVGRNAHTHTCQSVFLGKSLVCVLVVVPAHHKEHANTHVLGFLLERRGPPRMDRDSETSVSTTTTTTTKTRRNTNRLRANPIKVYRVQRPKDKQVLSPETVGQSSGERESQKTTKNGKKRRQHKRGSGIRRYKSEGQS